MLLISLGKYMLKAFQKVPSDIGKRMEYFLATGNLVSNTGLDLQQTAGFTVVAEKLNFLRYISHFRSVHRGAYFAELKTTTVRKLLPEAWGFLCPVHTPDGSPCGLLNHLSHTCKILTVPCDVSTLPELLVSMGVSPYVAPPSQVTVSDQDTLVSVQLDGRIIGFCSASKAVYIADRLRMFKIEKLHNVPLELEIGLVPLSVGGQYPGLYLFSGPARMMRPVRHLKLDKTDMIGPFEQVRYEKELTIRYT
jgi:DNA-directed RNA polymerase I subunit RPA2